jgi:1-acyl-sn-glycerol-3-phosphate acyltransferase
MFLSTFFVWTLGLAVTIFTVFLLSASYLTDPSGNRAHYLITIWAKAILVFAGVRVTIKGRENLLSSVPLIILSNHRGAFDIPVLQASLPVQFRWVAKKSLFSVPLIGWAMTFARYIAVDREQGSKAYRSLKKASENIKAGTSVLIFPEGTRNHNEGLLPFKRGAFLLAAMCKNAYIVPVAVNGTTGIMKRGGFFIRPSSVTVTIGKPFAATGDADELSEAASTAILNMLPV